MSKKVIIARHTSDADKILSKVKKDAACQNCISPYSDKVSEQVVYENPCKFIARYDLGDENSSATISAATKEELPRCLEVIHKSFKTVADEFGLTPENCPKHTSFIPLCFLETQMEWGWHMYTLQKDGEIIGYMSLSKQDDGAYELHNLAVLPKYRHLGFGKKMLDFAKSTVRSLGGEKIKIGIIEESTVLKNWYISNGFVHIGTKKFDHLPFTSGYLQWNDKNM